MKTFILILLIVGYCLAVVGLRVASKTLADTRKKENM